MYLFTYAYVFIQTCIHEPAPQPKVAVNALDTDDSSSDGLPSEGADDYDYMWAIASWLQCLRVQLCPILAQVP